MWQNPCIPLAFSSLDVVCLEHEITMIHPSDLAMNVDLAIPLDLGESLPCPPVEFGWVVQLPHQTLHPSVPHLLTLPRVARSSIDLSLEDSLSPDSQYQEYSDVDTSSCVTCFCRKKLHLVTALSPCFPSWKQQCKGLAGRLCWVFLDSLVSATQYAMATHQILWHDINDLHAASLIPCSQHPGLEPPGQPRHPSASASWFGFSFQLTALLGFSMWSSEVLPCMPQHMTTLPRSSPFFQLVQSSYASPETASDVLLHHLPVANLESHDGGRCP